MNKDACLIAAYLQAAIRCVDRDLDALWEASRLYAAVGEAQREPAGVADAALPLEGQRSLVADSKSIAHLLPRRELPKIKRSRVHIQLCLPGLHRWSHLYMYRDLRIPPV